MRPILSRLATLLFLVLLATLPSPASAQVALSGGDTETAVPALPDPLTPDAVRGLVSRLSDGEVRALLLDRLDAVASEATAARSTSAGNAIRTSLAEVSDSIATAFRSSPDLLSGLGRGFGNFLEPRGWSGVGRLVGLTLLALALGFIAERTVIRLRGLWRGRDARELPDTLGHLLIVLVKRAFFEAIGLVAFFYVARYALGMFLPTEAPPSEPGIRHASDLLAATTFFTYVVMWPRALLLFNRFVSAPYEPHLRLIHVDDWTARYLYRNLALAFGLWGFVGFIVPFLATHGVQVGELRLGFWLTLTVYAILMYTTWRARPGLRMMMRGDNDDITPGEETFIHLYPYIGMVLIFLNWLLIEMLVAKKLFHLIDGRETLTLMLLLFAPTFDTAVRGIVRRMTPPPTGEGLVAHAAYQRAKRSYIRIGRVLATVLVVLTVAWLWEIDLTNIAASGVGFRIAGRLIEGIMIALVGYLIWELSSLWINRKLAAERTAMGFDGEDESVGDEGGTGVSRLATVLPLLLGVLKVTIIVIFGLIVIDNFGIDTTPLLAGAGIVGLAIGFGAQKLVADIVSGIFFLVDDAFRAGEYLDVDGTMGTVEKISVRSMQLRHHKGAVHTIPYGEIPKITNFSRDWVIMKLKFTVPFDTDPNKVKKIFKKIGAEMMTVPEYAEDFLQPFKSQGVFDFDDVGMIIRGKFMAKPGKQFVLRKEVYNRVIRAFEEAGISFARREVRVAIPGIENTSLTPDQRESIAAAASDAAGTPTSASGGGDDR